MEQTIHKKPERKIQICMGSACHLKGAPLIAQAFQIELDKRQQTHAIAVDLGGAFVRINGETHTHVTVADVPALVDLCLQEG